MFIYRAMETEAIQKEKNKPEEEEKRGSGRTKTEIDWEKVGNFLKAQCSAVGIAGMLGISTDTLYLRCKQDLNLDYTVFSQLKKSEGKELLRAKQYNDALAGNITMQIWLGKQYLDQKDKQEFDVKNNSNDIENMTKEQLEEKLKKLKEVRNGTAKQ